MKCITCNKKFTQIRITWLYHDPKRPLVLTNSIEQWNGLCTECYEKNIPLYRDVMFKQYIITDHKFDIEEVGMNSDEEVLETYGTLQDRFTVKDKEEQEKIRAIGYELINGCFVSQGTWALIEDDMKKWKENGYHCRVSVGSKEGGTVSLIGRKIINK
jgi:hypothetical protein